MKIDKLYSSHFMRFFKFFQIIIGFVFISNEQAFSQNFTNSDLDGTIFTYSALPIGWQSVPATDPVCLSSDANIGDTPDLCNATQPDISVGMGGYAYSGDKFVSGLRMNGASVIFHEGIQQTVTGLTVGDSYAIEFYQAVVKQVFALDNSGSWSVYMDNTLLGTTPTSQSATAYDDPNLEWDARSVSFTPTATTHTFKFLPTDDDSNLSHSLTDPQAGLRMGIDLITINADCTLDLGPDVSLCNDDLPYEIGTALAGIYDWNNGETTASIQISDSGLYILEVTTDCGVVIDSILVEITPQIPQVDLGPDMEVCPQDFPITLTSDVTGSYFWSTGQMTESLSVTEAGEYSITVFNSCGAVFDTIEITEGITGPSVNLGADLSLCSTDFPYDLGTTSSGTYEWNTGETTAFIQVSDSGLYFLEVSGACGVATDSIFIEIPTQILPFDLGPDLDVCPQDFPITLSANVTGQYLWNTTEQTQAISVNTGGEYTVSVFNACEAVNDTVNITVANGSPSVNLGADLMLCAEDFPYSLDAGVNDSYAWSNGENTPTISATGPGDFAVTVSNTCGSASDEVTLNLLLAPDPITLGNDFSTCENLFPVVLAIEQTDHDIVWSTGSIEEQISVNSEGNYDVLVSNQCGFSTASINILAIPNPMAQESIVLCQGESVNFLGETFFQEGSFDFVAPSGNPSDCDIFWNVDVTVIPTDTVNVFLELGDGEIAIYEDYSFVESGIYFYTESVPDGCDIMVKFIVDVEDELFVYVPSAFSPDEDGINELFKPVITLLGDISINYYAFEIYDRYGQIVHESIDPRAIGWNGAGAIGSNYYVQDGIYNWVLRYGTTQSSDRFEDYGTVLIAR